MFAIAPVVFLVVVRRELTTDSLRDNSHNTAPGEYG